MSTSATHHAAHLSADVALRGATVFTAVQLGLANRRRHIESHRRAGVDAVTDLAGRLREARASEEEAWSSASSLAHENAALRETLAAHQAALEAAQARIERLERAVLVAADRLAR
jgi:chromosome segregation ATPase